MSSEEMKDTLLRWIKEKKVESVESLYVGEKTVLTDYFLIVTVRNALQVRMMFDYLAESAEKIGLSLNHQDGEHASGWMVMDFGSVIVHIFTIDKKDFYSLEDFWKNKK